MRIAIKQVKARKQTVCNVCGNQIESGEHYSTASYMVGTYHKQIKACLKHTWAELRAFVEVREGANN